MKLKIGNNNMLNLLFCNAPSRQPQSQIIIHKVVLLLKGVLRTHHQPYGIHVSMLKGCLGNG